MRFPALLVFWAPRPKEMTVERRVRFHDTQMIVLFVDRGALFDVMVDSGRASQWSFSFDLDRI